jgi:hypothetical protein
MNKQTQLLTPLNVIKDKTQFITAVNKLVG